MTTRSVRGRGRRRRSPGHVGLGTALLWLAPALVLIIGVVALPAVLLVDASLANFSITGLRRGSAGLANYVAVLNHPMLPTVLLNTVVWVVAVVAITIVFSLAIAQLASKDFLGRRVLRTALILPWAASLVITAQVFMLIYDYNYGLLNPFLQTLGLIAGPVDWLGDDAVVRWSFILVGVFVSIPFTTFVFIAGLSAIPDDVYEAARIDGASPWRAYRSITLPLLRPALLIATVLNTIYVFNSFPIICTLNDRNPGYTHDTTITFMYKLAFKSQEKDVGMSAAAGILNVLLILVVVAIYLKIVDPRKEADA
ncbi:sugar ABC transporter permease [Propioniciclava soli]|uniref:Sugar ABC transporter permease n=1 Tax=Propioniciclava soli TaxID=2775081 RepID=A0ABZ3C5U4_9ACTN